MDLKHANKRVEIFITSTLNVSNPDLKTSVQGCNEDERQETNFVYSLRVEKPYSLLFAMDTNKTSYFLHTK